MNKNQLSGNWKMNKTPSQGKFIHYIENMVSDIQKTEVIFFPAFLFI